jgi:hypothetical protein
MLEWHGAAEIRRNIEQATDASTVHHCHTPEIALVSPTTARGIWAMEDIVESTARLYHAFGHYNETYVLEGGQWKFASVHITRLRIQILQGGFEPLARDNF